MSGIDSGILVGAKPLTAEQIKALEERTLFYRKPVAFLNEDGDLCFFLTRGSVDGLKEIAWHNACELSLSSGDDSMCVRRSYIRTGIDTYDFIGTDAWGSCDTDWVPEECGDQAAEYLTCEFYDDDDWYCYFDVVRPTENEDLTKDSPAESWQYPANLPADLFIPSDINGYCLYEVGQYAFCNCAKLKSVAFGRTISSLSSYTFYKCTNLTSVRFPDGSETNVGARAFQGCTSLREVYLGRNFFKLGSNVFNGCTSLEVIYYNNTTSKWMEIEPKFNSSWQTDMPTSVYVQCTDGRWYLDGHTTLEGAGQEYNSATPAMMSFRSQEPLDEFQAVVINGEIVDPSNYILEEGSTIVRLSPEYLATLPVGQHRIEVISKNAAPFGTFTVVKPELNEHNFYYNQPYCANVPYLGGSTVVFIHDGGELELIYLDNHVNTFETCSYTIADRNLNIVGVGGNFTARFSDDGTSAYVPELDATFELCSDNRIAADANYLYVYNEELAGYEVYPIDKTGNSYQEVKTGINGIDTVKLADYFLMDNTNIRHLPGMSFALNEIGSAAFQGCNKLTSVEVNAARIGAYAFNSCYNITELYLPAYLEYIDWYAFANCTALEEIYFDGTVEQWNAVEKGSPWYYNIKARYVQCIDGQVELPVIEF